MTKGQRTAGRGRGRDEEELEGSSGGQAGLVSQRLLRAGGGIRELTHPLESPACLAASPRFTDEHPGGSERSQRSLRFPQGAQGMCLTGFLQP